MRPTKSLCQQPDCTGSSRCPNCRAIAKRNERLLRAGVDPSKLGPPDHPARVAETPICDNPVAETPELPTEPVAETLYTPSTFGQPNHVPFWTPLPNATPTRAKCSACSPPGQDLVLLCLLCVDNRFRCQQCLSRTAKFYPLGSEHVDMAPPRLAG